MNLRYVRTFVVALVAAVGISSAAFAQAAEKVGSSVVRSTDGGILSQVWVQELGARRGRLIGPDGRFQFTVGKPVTLLFYKGGFRPQIRVTTGSEGTDDLSVLLDHEAVAAVSLRFCRRQRGCPLCEIEPFKVPGLRIKRIHNIEYDGYDATYRHGGSCGVLSSVTGVHVGGLSPTPAWVAGLSSFTVRSVRCGGEQWFDLRGVTEAGLESRWVGGAGYVEYSKVPGPVARAFDKAIDNGCCR
jgi:hypothetical protein